MTESYDLNRLRAAFAEPDDPPHPDRCPSLSEIWDGVHGKLPAGRLRDVVDHLATCSPCAEAWRMALAMERPEGAESFADAPAGVPVAPTAGGRDGSRSRPGWRVYGALIATAALLAVVVGTRDLRRGPAPQAIIAQRGGEPEPRTATRWLTPGDAALPSADARLSWSGPPGAVYDLTVELVDERGAARPLVVAAPRGLPSTEYTLYPRDLARVPAGALLHAALTAHLPDGRSETIFRDFRVP